MSGVTQRYISKELVHFFGRGFEQDRQFHLLLKIVKEGWITHPRHNPNIGGNLTVNTSARISNNEMYTPQIVCFSDIPIQDLSIHTKKYSPFGLSFSKEFIVSRGGIPIHYIPRSGVVGGNLVEHIQETVSNADYFDKMVAEYHEVFQIFLGVAPKIDRQPGVSGLLKRVIDLQRFLDFHIFSNSKFFDHTLSDDHKDNYYFEREWRVVGNVKFSPSDIKTIFMPSGFSEKFWEEYPQYKGQLIFVD